MAEKVQHCDECEWGVVIDLGLFCLRGRHPRFHSPVTAESLWWGYLGFNCPDYQAVSPFRGSGSLLALNGSLDHLKKGRR